MIYLTQLLHQARAQYPEATATVFGTRRQSYGQLVERVSRIAGVLQRLGLSKGDRVAILSLSSDRYVELYYAIWWAGGIACPLNTRWSTAEIAFALDECRANLLVLDRAFAGNADALVQRAPALRSLIYTGDDEAPAGMVSLERLIAGAPPAPDALRANQDTAAIYYTGGTTGKPKGVMLSHQNLWSTCAGAMEAWGQKGQNALHTAPLFHLAGARFLIGHLMRGTTQVILPAFDAGEVLRAIEREEIGVAVLVPAMIQMVLDHPDAERTKLSSLWRLLYGASPISESLLDRVMARLPEVEFIQSYGLTEMTGTVSLLWPEDHRARPGAPGRLRSAGQPAWFAEIRVLLPDGSEAPRGTVGEVVARGPGLMQGYWGKPEETAAALRDGWMHSGDGGYLDQDGYLYIVDRIKDMIVSGGENVYSAEVESVVARHPAVAVCAVIGIPDARWGEAVHAVLVCRPGHEAPAIEALRLHCKSFIAGYKCPRSLEVRSELPLSGAGKVLKTVLREPYWSQQQRRVG